MNKAQLSEEHNWEAPLVFLLFFLFYLPTLCGISAAAPDSIDYLLRIDNTLGLNYPYNPLFHPHHLLFNGLARLWLKFCRLTGVTSESDLLIAGFNALWGSGSLTIFYRLLRDRLKYHPFTALLGTMLPAFSFGFWFYSVCVEVCIIPLFFLLLSFYLLTGKELDGKSLYLAGMFQALAVLLHQAHVLFLMVVLGAIWLGRERLAITRVKAISCYLISFISGVAIPYLIVSFYILRFDSIIKLWGWLTSYAHESANIHPLSLATLLKAAIGFGRSLIGANFIFAIPWAKEIINKFLSGHDLRDEVYLVRNLETNGAYFLLALSGIFFSLLIYAGFRLWRKSRLLNPESRDIFQLAGIWFAVYALFFIFWVGHNLEFWIPQSLCFWLMGLVILAQSEKKARWLLTAAGLLLTLNFFGGLRFLRDKNNDFYYKKSAPLAGLVSKRDLIIVGQSINDEQSALESWNVELLYFYLLKYTPADVINLNLFEEKSQLKKLLDHTLAEGHKIIIFEEALGNLGRDDLQTPWNNYVTRRQMVDLELNAVYILNP
ncbi:MAG: hypothetical protein HZA78_07235 [Candidatus Schekmanbacteria bacterium]|nr:hypothetical protein [Candidatus Schekmanbacteria bacterium]